MKPLLIYFESIINYICKEKLINKSEFQLINCSQFTDIVFSHELLLKIVEKIAINVL